MGPVKSIPGLIGWKIEVASREVENELELSCASNAGPAHSTTLYITSQNPNSSFSTEQRAA